MVVTSAPVDIPALKARHPLGDTVEAAGVRLRGRGRVRQGVCPFHDEAEGSFTVYADSERFYCFGCAAKGGDVLDFVRLDGEPDACPKPSRGWTAAQGLCPGPPLVQPERGRPKSAAVPLEGHRPADRGVALLRRTSSGVHSEARAVPGLAGRRPVRRSPPSASAIRRAAGCGRPWSPWGFSADSASRTQGCLWSGERSGSPGWSSFPTSPPASSAGS